MSFENDIQGQNTQLYPVVVIDDEWYSTNNTTIDGNYCKPILMDIPSIKESIDIESRKFKISSVTLNFNNFPFEGKRFSDQLSETSLINKEVIIYFKSPSELREVYNGRVRRITHDDSIVGMQLEDITEQKSNVSLPKQIITSEDVLDKYKNKPIPIVYGDVDGSPLIVRETDENGQTIFSADFQNNRIKFKDSDPLLIFRNESFLKVLEESVNYNDSELSDLNFTNGTQYTVIDSEIVLDSFLQSQSGEISQITNPISINTAEVVFTTNYNTVKLFTNEDNYINQESVLSSIDPTSDVGEYMYGLPEFQQQILDDFGFIEHIGFKAEDIAQYTFISDEALGYSQEINQAGAFMLFQTYLYKIAYNFLSSPDPFVGLYWQKFDTYYNIILDNTNRDFVLSGYIFYINLLDGNFAFGNENSDAEHPNLDDKQIIISKGSDDTSDINEIGTHILEMDRSEFETNSIAFESMLQNKQEVGSKAEGRTRADIQRVTKITNYFIDKFNESDFFANVYGRANLLNDHPFLNELQFYDDEETIQIFYDNIDDIMGNAGFDAQAIQNFTTLAEMYYEGTLSNSLTFMLLDIAKDLVGTTFISIENPIDIIYDILRNELNFDKNQIDETSYEIARNEHLYWKFGFTVNKSIDAKKLIENIAKSTKSFPKFRSDGTFGFSTIKNTYTLQDYNNAIPIAPSDAISYSFKKTKPEQIYRQVDVQYNMNYSQDSLMTTTPIKENGASDFYAIEETSNAYLQFKSPYIRDYGTAIRLRNFLASHYKNDHLLININLPLKYISLEIGDIVKFEELFQGLKAYGIDYRVLSDVIEDSYLFPLFMITSITKNINSIQIECMQLHYLSGALDLDEVTGWQSLTFPDADPLTITPFIPEPVELLGEELIFNNSGNFGNLIGWYSTMPSYSIIGDTLTLTGTNNMHYIAKTGLIDAGDTRLYRLTIDIESFEGEKWDVSANGVTYGNGTGASIRSEHQDQPTGVFTTEFVWNNSTHGQVPGNFEHDYGIRIHVIGTMVLNSVSLREVIQEAPPFDGGLIVGDDNAWTLPTGASQGEAYVEDNVLIYNNAYVSGAASLKYLHTEELNSNETYRVRFEIFDWVEGSFKISLRHQLTPAATGNDIYEFYINPSVSGLNYSYTYTGGNPAYYPDVRGTFKVKNLSIHEVEDNASVLVSRNRFKVDELLQEKELYTEDNKYDLKDLKDME